MDINWDDFSDAKESVLVGKEDDLKLNTVVRSSKFTCLKTRNKTSSFLRGLQGKE